MDLTTFQKYVIPSLVTEHKTAAAIKTALDAYIKTDPITELVEGKAVPVELEVKEADGKVQVIKAAQKAPDPFADQVKTLIEASVKDSITAMTKDLKITNEKNIVIRDKNQDDPRGGYNSFGEMALSVYTASKMAKEGQAHSDSRLKALWNKGFHTKAPTSYGDVTTGADGGYLIPQEFSYRLWQLAFADNEVLGRCDNSLKIAGNNIKIPVDETTPWGGTGIQARWEGEGVPLVQDKPVLEQDLMSLHKLATLVPVTNELLSDSPIAIDGYVSHKAGIAIRYKATDGVINGTGVGMPLGFMKSGALLKLARTTTGTIKTADIYNLYAAIYSVYRDEAVWLVNQIVEGTLMNLPNLTVGTAFPLYMPKGFGGNKYATMLGLPVIPCVSMAPLGMVGDIAGASLGQYLLLQKASGIEAAQSIHLFFDYDMTAFRFIFRADGRPWQSQPITLPTYTGQGGSDTGLTEGVTSSFVALAH